VYLALQVTGQKAAMLGANASKLFDQRGGSVGRSPDADWTLPDPERFISGQHFIVRCMNNAFYLEDVSTNGVFLNGRPERVSDRGDAVILNTGDRITIGDYEMVVSLVSEVPEAAVPASSRPPEPAAPQGPANPPPLAGTPVDPLDLLGRPPPVAPERPATYSDHSPGVSQHFTPPGTAAEPGDAAIPDDWELTGHAAPAPDPSATTSTPALPSGGSAPFQIPDDDDIFGSMVPGGPLPALTPVPAPQPQPSAAPVPDARAESHSTGPLADDRLMRLIIQGLMDVLRSRADIKSQFRVPVTTLKPVENNPLKFSVTVDDAMQHLFGSVKPGFMTPEAAVEEGLMDIKAHQLAVMAGMRAAFGKMLERFNPERLEKQFSEVAKSGSLISMKGKGRYWDLYRDTFGELTRDSDENFNRLFGEAFAEAYEQQMQKLLSGK
jgi:type VI secretion system protein ImpI